MKRYNTTDPAALYSECWEYVVECTMKNCPHLRREEAEDISSQAFTELMQKGKTNIQNWAWTAKMRGLWDYKTQHMRYKPSGTMYDIRGGGVVMPDSCEVFHPGQLLVRKDAKAAFSLMMQGYNRAEVAEQLYRHPISVTKMMERLRNRCKEYLKSDIKIYRNE